MKNKNLSEQTFTQGAAVLLLSTVLVKLISAFFKIPLSSDYCLGDLGFGYFSSVYDIYIPIYTLAGSGFPVALAKMISSKLALGKTEEAQNIIYTFKKVMFILGVIGFISVLLLAKPFSNLTDDTGKTFLIMIFMAPAVTFSCLSSSYRGISEGYSNMIPHSISSVIEALSKVLLGFTGAFVTVKITNSLSFGAAAAMLGISFGSLLSFIYLKFAVKDNRKKDTTDISAEYKKEIMRDLIITALPIVFASFAGSVVSFIDALTVKFQLSVMMKENFEAVYSCIQDKISLSVTAETLPTVLYGIRSKAFTLFNLVPTFTIALGISGLPVITKAFSKGDINGTKKGISTLIKFASVISFPIAFGMIFTSSRVTELLYGDSTAILGGEILIILSCAAAFAGPSMALASALQGINKQKSVLINFSIGLLVKILLNILLVDMVSLNIYGSAISTAVCYLYIFISNILVIKKSGLLADIKNTILKPLFSALLCGVSAYFILKLSSSNLITVLAIAVAGVVYFAILAFSRCFKSYDFDGLPLEKQLKKLFFIAEIEKKA